MKGEPTPIQVLFHDISIEATWAKRPNFFNPQLTGANDFIEKALSNAIIKED